MFLEYFSILVKCFRVRPRACHRLENLKGALVRSTPVLTTNIRLGWKGLPGTSTLAYYKHSKITTVKSFITFGSDECEKLEVRNLYNFIFLILNLPPNVFCPSEHTLNPGIEG
jgi:hypothetical protein